jgi:hypothetical protein
MNKQTRDKEQGEETIENVQKQYISFLGDECNKLQQFAGVHGYNISKETFAKGQTFRDKIAHLEIIGQASQSKSALPVDEQEDFLTVARQWQEWSIQAFPKATSVISLKKLRAELNELIDEIESDTPSPLQDEGIPLLEFADCFMCLLHSAAREGFDPEQITRAIKNKALINKTTRSGKKTRIAPTLTLNNQKNNLCTTTYQMNLPTSLQQK